jgi:addiction module HigA family antidote
MIRSFRDKETDYHQRGDAMTDWREPIHPGEVLRGELETIGMKPVEFARRIGVPNNRIYQILDYRRSITADTALRLGKFFGTGPEFWLNLQKTYELDVARQQVGNALERIMPYQLDDQRAIHPNDEVGNALERIMPYQPTVDKAQAGVPARGRWPPVDAQT